MNRTIKFRAWDNKEKIWFKDIDMDGLELAKFDNVEYSQYTGLKDVTGSGVYEGDIIESEILSGDIRTNEVIFEFGAFRVGLQPLNVQTDIRVIGNKYEGLDNE